MAISAPLLLKNKIKNKQNSLTTQNFFRWAHRAFCFRYRDLGEVFPPLAGEMRMLRRDDWLRNLIPLIQPHRQMKSSNDIVYLHDASSNNSFGKTPRVRASLLFVIDSLHARKNGENLQYMLTTVAGSTGGMSQTSGFRGHNNFFPLAHFDALRLEIRCIFVSCQF